jgi:hypothetical protein
MECGQNFETYFRDATVATLAPSPHPLPRRGKDKGEGKCCQNFEHKDRLKMEKR